MKASWIFLAAAFSLLAGTVLAQAQKPERLLEAPPKQEKGEDAFLTHEKALDLLKEVEGKQQSAIDQLEDLLEKARACQSSKCKSCQTLGQKQTTQQNKPQPPHQYSIDASGSDPIETFRSPAEQAGCWGPLPPRISSRVVPGKLVEYSAEFREVLKEYMRVLAEEE